MSAKYLALLTHIGAAKLANATALGNRLNISQMAVGDGGGVLPTPNPAQTALINETRRAALNSLSVDPKNPSQIIAEQVIPENDGGWWIREIGLFDDDGNLIAIANCPETYKPQLQEGSGRIQTVRMILIVSSTDAVTLKIDPAVVLATRSYVDSALAEHEKSRKHPDGTLTAPGFVQLSNATNSDSETLAATPKAVKVANDNANGRVPSGRRVNGKALTADITLGAGDVGAYTKLETDTAVSVATTAANTAATAAANANTNANSRVPSDRRVNGKALSADIALNAADVGAYTTSETDTRVAAAITAANNAATAAANADTNANGRVPSGRTVNGKALSADIALGAGDVGALAKNQNGADIPNKVMFAKNASVPYLGSGWVNFGNSAGAWTTQQFVDFLNDMGAFDHLYFVCAATWSYATNRKITNTGCGNIELSGATVEVFADRFYLRTIRVTTMATSNDPASVPGQFIYVDEGNGGRWRREFNTENLTPSSIGAIQGNELVGIPQPCPLVTAPEGWLACAGQSFDTSRYPVLASRYPQGRLPDLRGEFIRGWDNGRGVDTGRGNLSSQSFSTEPHTHDGGTLGLGSGAPIYTGKGLQDGAATLYSQTGVNNNSGTETRPRNIAFNYIVRAA
ncbi:phage tail protein [Pectobacterium carotovorum]|uniref:phage tail-collar fiber domain-containing protein n=1 Tax=Pectobacterium TaxID=122277 RepID=UPI0015DF5905|nr:MULTISPECIES: phage tail protein [Pectobacterium]MBQ4781305.1 phage tail protein [Pectobacterium versatile]MBQ4785861.1 phage tail protein [Pectobacterium versatile]QLL92377.1 phage tail protein [Pectobacterium carotovorum]